MKLTPPDLFTPPEKALREYLTRNHHRPEFAVARRQQWPKLLDMLSQALDKIRDVHLAFTRQRFVAGGLYMAGTGALSEAQIRSAELLSAEEKRQCCQLLALHQRATPLAVANGLPDPLPRAHTGATVPAEDHTADYLVWEAGGAYLARLYGSGENRTWLQVGVFRVLHPSHYQSLIPPPHAELPASAGEPAAS